MTERRQESPSRRRRAKSEASLAADKSDEAKAVAIAAGRLAGVAADEHVRQVEQQRAESVAQERKARLGFGRSERGLATPVAEAAQLVAGVARARTAGC